MNLDELKELVRRVRNQAHGLAEGVSQDLEPDDLLKLCDVLDKFVGLEPHPSGAHRFRGTTAWGCEKCGEYVTFGSPCGCVSFVGGVWVDSPTADLPDLSGFPALQRAVPPVSKAAHDLSKLVRLWHCARRMKRFLVFAYDDYYPCGGCNDLVGGHSTLEYAIASVKESSWYDWHVLDTETGVVTCKGTR